ncbi:bifunctional 2-C-methyl-D-erythritol 4-phosphate cytidylyltransferase/2-C-methyl-D-erythritol 2,4-cyclodiphosphate synthase [Nordella sp. HKS 07]|uniref:bifunctional 2-C-methyl-D-erythritol 4-phosphate cytidylyltransferase/2-C-methyl-D-erythritol 2,4-cyclodiphosphate synthase n=1 Tax=Nordella sp. HKS 07 TaxID=2712222 RepID=UPI0013E0FD85|nr:bifunctional 2-C-methyl-D-erythritol 4-phosphate cytidylyltransferase/2-C-methyl-D-erythritol 2,4-cyclodiphosphate synthase [Nordella sp. HKS 07]QIG51174.1 bifunctional 2-C-methyl-D-erythritol 4-phosphate cytidylyltransferase/2-C-methyl-D-erythritol 2,4-cyclodiphosphate synthase [Nordella sp. HKS 07]
MKIGAVVVAAGSGSRAGGEKPKQYQTIGGRPVLWWTLKALLDHPRIAAVQTVIGPYQTGLFRDAVSDLDIAPPVTGGATRQESCRIGLEALARHGLTHVLIHDAARPFLSPELIDRVIAGLATHQGAVPGLAVADTLKRAASGTIERTIDRSGLWAVQTPQGFAYDAICAAHEKARQAGHSQLTDDAAVAEFVGLDVAIVAGSPENRKMTTMDDIAEADRTLNRNLTDIRTGMGVDIHAFAPGDHVMLCGVRIDHTQRLAGHSDADVALHALTDAILGAIGEGDIGTFFPPSDPQWKDAPSSIFLSKAVELVRQRGGKVGNADIAILAEVPRISPHLAAMKSSLSAMLGIGEDRIAIKATTAETLGFVGRREGVTAFANVIVRLPG